MMLTPYTCSIIMIILTCHTKKNPSVFFNKNPYFKIALGLLFNFFNGCLVLEDLD